jgi:ATP-binding cassette, subfamily B, multidrug efflux pump
MPRPHSENEQRKAKNPKLALKRLLQEFKPQLPLIIFICVLLTAAAIFYIVEPIILKKIVNGLATYIEPEGGFYKVDWAGLSQLFALLFITIATSNVFGWLSEFLGIKLTKTYGYRLDNALKKKLDHLPLSYFDGQSYGDVLSTGVNDVDNIGHNSYGILSQSISATVELVGCIVAMLITSWQLALIVIVSLPITAFVVMMIGKRSQVQFKRYRAKYGILEGQIEEAYNGYKLLKVFNREETAQNKFDAINEEMTEADRKSQWISGFIYPSMRFISQVGFVAVAVGSGLIYADGNSLGILVAFLFFLNIISQPFQMLGQISTTFQSVMASTERVFAILDMKEETPDAPDAIMSNDQIKGEVIFDHVAFSYSPDKPLIQDMNLKVQPGETIAIVGPTGAGKTTLVNLIMRFYEINSGTIYLDGVDTRHYARHTLRGAIGMVLQETWLFNGTIRENIRYGNNDATDEEVYAAAKAARVDHFIETLPGGYDFVLNEDGSNVSQGQRQLITIARAICSKPKIMILDEATSSVDTRTEKAIQDAMDEIMRNRTSFVIAHRLSTIKNAKEILVMNQGSIIEMGTHQELLAKQGFYADLYNSQFLGKQDDTKNTD